MTTKTYQEMSNQELVAEYVRLGGTAPASGKFRDKAAGIKAIEARVGGFSVDDLISAAFEEPASMVRGGPENVLIDPNDTLEKCAERRSVELPAEFRTLPPGLGDYSVAVDFGELSPPDGGDLEFVAPKIGRFEEYLKTLPKPLTVWGKLEFISTPLSPGGISARFRFYRVRSKRRPSYPAPSKEAFQALKLARRAQRRALKRVGRS